MNMPPMPERLWFATAARSKRAAEVSVATAGRQSTGVSLRRMPRQRNLQRILRLSISKQRLREFAENQNLEEDMPRNIILAALWSIGLVAIAPAIAADVTPQRL